MRKSTTPAVMHIIHNLKREGAQKVCFNIVTSLDSRKFTPLVFSFKEGGPLLADLEQFGVVAHTFPSSRHFSYRRLLKHLVGLIRSENILLLHAHMSESAILAAMASIATKVPFVITHHSNRLLPRLPLDRWILRATLFWYAVRVSSMNIAVAADVESKLQKYFKIPSQKKIVIHNGVPVAERLSRKHPATGSENLLNSRHWPHLVTVGRVIDIKGQDFLLESASSFFEVFPHGKITVVGEGEKKNVWRGVACEKGFGDRILFVGEVGNVDEILQVADAYVSTSHYEGLPMAVMEAMAQGVPVIATDVPGNNDLIEDGRTGILFKQGDIPSYIKALQNLFMDDVVSDRLAQQAYLSIKVKFGIDAMARSYEAVYEKIIH